MLHKKAGVERWQKRNKEKKSLTRQMLHKWNASSEYEIDN